MTNSSNATYRDPFTSDDPRANRKGRRGSRAKLAQRFFEDTYAAWEEQGPSILARAAFHDPVAFANMVARLMPQKIEVSTPTDGMSDERLAEMLDLAERMARLRAGEGVKVIEGSTHDVATPLRLDGSNHENGLAQGFEAKGGGGPDRVEPHGGINTSSPLRADPAETTVNPVAQHNKLNPSAVATDIAKTPYPVGRAQPLSDAEAIRLNKAKLHDAEAIRLNKAKLHDADDPVDPASLF